MQFSRQFPYENSQAAAAGSAGSAGTAGAASPGIIDFDFSSFIIGEGAVAAAFILTVRWRSTASLNLNECSSSFSVSPSHFDVHQNVVCLVDLLDRVSQLAATPVFQTMNRTALGGDDGTITLDHAGHLFALVRMDDKDYFVMAHAISFWDIPSAMRVR